MRKIVIVLGSAGWLALGVVECAAAAKCEPLGRSPGQCALQSAGGIEVRVFEDTSCGDEGDLLAAVKLGAGETSAPISSSTGRIRYKVRASVGGSWQSGGGQLCRGGAVLPIP